MDCIFCKIMEGEIPSYTVYEDEVVKVFLDINPSTNGDLLLVPKIHTENIMTIDKDLLDHLTEIIRRLYAPLKEKLHCDGFTIVQNNEYGQDIKHFHIHMTPRYHEDALTQTYNKTLLKDIEEVFNILKSE